MLSSSRRPGFTLVELVGRSWYPSKPRSHSGHFLIFEFFVFSTRQFVVAWPRSPRAESVTIYLRLGLKMRGPFMLALLFGLLLQCSAGSCRKRESFAVKRATVFVYLRTYVLREPS
jgi:hypothetical protein